MLEDIPTPVIDWMMLPVRRMIAEANTAGFHPNRLEK
jgi:hypothetical protein